MKKLQDIDVFLFDMDGTLNMGEEPIEGAMETLRILNAKGKKVYFVTNNSSKARVDYQKKIKRLGYEAELNQIVTSGMATAAYLNKHYSGKKIYVLGTETLKSELRTYDIDVTEEEDADVMVLAFDTELTYKKLWKATNIVAAGKPYIATHPDFVCPSDHGNMPDAGAYIALVEKVTGRLPDVVVGKPYAPMAEFTADFCGVTYDQMAFVGDRLYTDIKFAVNNGMTGILVMTGETTAEMLAVSEVKPDYVLPSVNDLR